MYFVSVWKNDEEIVRRKPFPDFSVAIGFFLDFYQIKLPGRSVLGFTTEIVNGLFARSFVALTRPEKLKVDDPFYEKKYHMAAKQSNSFSYDADYLFMVESEHGIKDAEAVRLAHEK